MLFNHYVALALTLVAGASSILASPLRQSEGMDLATRDFAEGMNELVTRTRHSSPEPDNPPPYNPKPDKPPPYVPKPPLPPIPEEGRRHHRRALVEEVVNELVARTRHSSPEPDNPPPYNPKPDKPPPYVPKPPLPPIPEEGRRHHRRALVEEVMNELVARTRHSSPEPDNPPPYNPRPDKPPPYVPKPPLPPIPEESRRHHRRALVEDLVNELVARTRHSSPEPDNPPPYNPRPDKPPPYVPKPPLPPIPEEGRRHHRREFVEAW